MAFGGPGSVNPGPAAPVPTHTAEISICPKGSTVVAAEPGRYNAKTGAGGGFTCPPGTTQAKGVPSQCCAGAAGGGGGGLGIPGLGGITGSGKGGGAGGSTWVPGKVERPALAPINPKAEYDPKVAEALARQTQYGTMLEQGAGHSMDVLLGTQADQMESQIAQMRAQAAQQGIPFDEASARSQLMRSVNASMAQEKLGREKAIGEAYAQQAQTSLGQAGERDTRLSLDEKAQEAQNAELLQRYGIDVSKYGVDAQAATAANNALLDFYSRLMSGMFGMFGSMGSSSVSSQNYYG